MQLCTVTIKGQVSIPKAIRDELNINPGDSLGFTVVNKKIVVEPTVNIPRSQAYFWTKEVQEKIKASEENYKKGNYTRYENVDELIKDLEKRDE